MPRSSSPSSSVFASVGDAPSRNADARAFPSVRASRRVAARGDAMTPARGRRRGVDASASSTVDAKPLPRILRDWARHHVELFVRDGDSDAHSIVSDYDGNALSVDARRAVHEEARRRGVRARSEEHSRDGGAKIVTLRRGAMRRMRRVAARKRASTTPTTPTTKRSRGGRRRAGTRT